MSPSLYKQKNNSHVLYVTVTNEGNMPRYLEEGIPLSSMEFMQVFWEGQSESLRNLAM